MFNFNSLESYGTPWSVASSDSLPKEVVDSIARTEVVNSNFGLSVCFFMKAGGTKYIPLSRDCSLGLGDSADLTNGRVLTLSRVGDPDTYRWQE